MDRRVEHGELDVLSSASSLPREERRGQGLGGGVRGQLVADELTHQLRVVGAGALGIAEAAVGLDHVVVDPLLSVGSFAPEAADREVDQGGIHGAEVFVPDAHAFDDPGAKVLEQHVRTAHELSQDLLSALVAQVEHERALAAVREVERAGHAAAVRSDVAKDVSETGCLDLDHLGPLICEDRRRKGAGEHGRDVDDANASQGSRHVGFLVSMAAAAARSFYEARAGAGAALCETPRSRTQWEPHA